MIRRLDPASRDFKSGDALADPRLEQPSPLSIADWLALLRRMMHLSESKQRVICEELEEHLHERVRDLMLAGVSESNAVRLALEELGEVAALAQRFQTATNSRKRRIIMNTVFACAGMLVAAAGVTLLGSNRGSSPHTLPPSVFHVSEAQMKDAEALEQIVLDLHDTMTPRQIIDAIVATRKVGVSVDFGQLEQAGLLADEPFGLSAHPGSVKLVLAEMSKRSNPLGEGVDWRLANGTLTIDTTRNFDLRERTLICYAIGDIMQSMFASYGISFGSTISQITMLITVLVEPQLWVDNGGDIAQLRIVGGRMFIDAPPRMHERIQWILNELRCDALPPADVAQSAASPLGEAAMTMNAH